MVRSKFLDLLDGYVSSDEDGEQSFYQKAITGSVSHIGRTKFGSIFQTLMKKCSRVISFTSSRFYGIFLLTFGLLSLLLHFMKDYFNFYSEIPLSILVSCGVITLLAVPFLLSDKPLPQAMEEIPAMDFVFYEFFCIKRMHRREEGHGIHYFWAVVSGIVFSLLGAVVPFKYVVIGICITVYLFLAFLSSEFSFFFTFLAIPYIPLLGHPSIVLATLVGVTFLSVARKVLVGKRVFYFEKYDLLLILFVTVSSVTTLISGGVDSIPNIIIMISLTTVYPIAGCLITNRRLADATVNTIVISSVPVSIFAIYQFIAQWVEKGFSNIEGVGSTFGNSSVLACFLVVSMTFSFYFVTVRHNKVKKNLFFMTFILTFVALITTLSVLAFIALLFGFIAYCFTYLRHGSGILMGLLSLIPYGVLILNENMTEKISSIKFFENFSLWDYVKRWANSFKIFVDNIFFGTGLGKENFEEQYKEVSEIGDTMYSDSGNFLLEIGIEVGIFALIIFVSLFLVRIRHRAVYRTYVKHSSVSVLSRYSSIIIVSLFTFGSMHYLFADLSVYCIFFTLLSLGSATMRISKQEYDDRVHYFKDGASLSYSSVDIEIRD